MKMAIDAKDFPLPPEPPIKTFIEGAWFGCKETKKSIENGIRFDASSKEWNRIHSALFPRKIND